MLHRRDEEIGVKPANAQALGLANQLLTARKAQNRSFHRGRDGLGKCADAVVGIWNHLGGSQTPGAVGLPGQGGQRALLADGIVAEPAAHAPGNSAVVNGRVDRLLDQGGLHG